MGRNRTRIFVFGWLSFLGGADTKLMHLLVLLHKEFEITLVPNDAFRLKEKTWTQFLDKLRIRYALMEELPDRLEGFGLALCNKRFFAEGIADRAKAKGLKIIWSSEMMWHHAGEERAIENGVVDKVLYVSELQKRYLSKGYGTIPSCMTGNFIHPRYFPFQKRCNRTFTIGRLSRDDWVKYPEDFPVFYEQLDLPDTRFRVMAWNEALAEKYKWHRFDARWDLLPAQKETQRKFLLSLDLFVYPLGHLFKESWGRSTVEAMLTGCIPLVPPGHNFENLIVHGESGFICGDFLEYKEHAHRLCFDYSMRSKIALQCREQAVKKLCDRKQHLAVWKEVFR